MLSLISFFLSLFMSLAPAQQASGTSEYGKFCGQWDTDAANIIPDCAAQSSLNVEGNLEGNAVSKRLGYQKIATLTYSTSPVLGSVYFKDPSGSEVIVVCNDDTCNKSTNGSAFTQFYTSTTISARQFSFVSYNGTLYGADDAHDQVWSYNNTTLTIPAYPNIPSCSILAASEDRLICANTIANPSRVNFSKSGDFSTWTVGINSADPYYDDVGTPGDQVTGLKYWQGMLYVFKQYSITGCLLGDQYTTKCSVLTDQIGTIEQNSIVTTDNNMYFHGTDLNYWQFDGTYFNIISKQIQGTIKTLTAGSVQSNTQNGGSWANATQFPPQSWNIATVQGSIFPSSTSFNQNSGIGIISTSAFTTNISTSDFGTNIGLSSSVFQDSWTNNLISGRLGWVDPLSAWTFGNSPYTGFITASQGTGNPCSAGGSTDLAATLYTSSITVSSGSWSISSEYQDNTGDNFCSNSQTGPCFDLRIMDGNAGNYYALRMRDTDGSANKSVQIVKNVSNTVTIMTASPMSIPHDTITVYRIDRTTAGAMFAYAGGVFIGSTTFDNNVTSTSTVIAASCRNAAGSSHTFNYFNNFYQYTQSSSGTILSQTFDTKFSTPTWGPFSSTFTIQNPENQIDFYIQVSTSPNNDMWDSLVATSDTFRVTSAQKRYVRYDIIFQNYVSTSSPQITSISLPAATTGQFITQCIQPPSSITGWGILSCSQNLAGNGSLVFYTTSAVNCASLPTTPPIPNTQTWTTQTNNATITIATNTAFEIGVVSLLGSTTDQAQLNSCITYWKNGTPAPPEWVGYDSLKNAVYWAGSINNSTTNNRLFKYDLNNQSWYPFDVTANALLFYRNFLYFGNPSAGKWYQYAASGVNSDDGSNINSFWQSKNFSLGDLFQAKILNAVSLVSTNQQSGNMTVTYTNETGRGNNYSVNLGTTSANSYIRNNSNILIGSEFQFFNLKFGNNSVNPWDLLGYRLDYTVKPWRAIQQ